MKTAPAPFVQTAEASRTCRDCHRPVEGSRFYCDRDRDRRRALTFLEQTHRVLAHADPESPAFRAARGYVGLAMEELAK